ncbi:unnamed protein product [Tetraodon nigroviridis]|uniref:(spotted green pufferfish) hypothetical protein n=1 Tax=Tetraodon nigroviridis TaxID=99883 RepID=Q4RXD6_TETNG|nr:unnamed protein product [Tetraodon nigroviridis]
MQMRCGVTEHAEMNHPRVQIKHLDPLTLMQAASTSESEWAKWKTQRHLRPPCTKADSFIWKTKM